MHFLENMFSCPIRHVLRCRSDNATHGFLLFLIHFCFDSGDNHDKRQHLLQREGLNRPKKSTLLGIGGADLDSAGAEDMFSKSIYDPAKACAIDSLVEKTRPGRYTPRKVAASGLFTVNAPNESEHPEDGDSKSPSPSSTTVRFLCSTCLKQFCRWGRCFGGRSFKLSCSEREAQVAEPNVVCFSSLT